ncbi:MAG: alpha/beta fold hydrolase [Novosphingobium sp.]|nr:alpha/beta fold hydrolase [Novosphingobium sp.]
MAGTGERDLRLSGAHALWRAASERASGLRDEVARRVALARQPRPEGVSSPAARLLLGELPSLAARARHKAEPWQAAEQPQTVMILPGFGAHPNRMRKMGEALEQAGHTVHHWGLGLNLGPTPDNFAFLMRRVHALSRSHDEPVALVGWSLGGLFAREIARRQPETVARVITMGTPFSGDPRANNAWRAYQMVTGHAVDAPPVDDCDFAVKPPVPTIALWSARDGVIHPRSACGWPHERDRAVALRCTHLDFAGHPSVIREVLRQLDAAI